jgi:CRP-like cAMP-binding protein
MGQVTTDRAAKALASTALFGDVDADVADSVALASTTRSYRKGQILFFQGDPDDSVFVLLDGSIKVFVTSSEGDEMTLTTLRPPDSFGELAAIDGRPRSACAQALEPTTVVTFSRARFLDLLRAHPQLMERTLAAMASIVRRLTDQAADLVFLDLHGRVAKLLLTLAHPDGKDDDLTLDLNMTQADLARMVGASRQSVNQILHEFQKRGYLELTGRKVIVKRPDRLRTRAGG